MGSRSIVATRVALLACGLVGTATAAARTDSVTMSASVHGRDVAAARETDPLRLEPGESVEVAGLTAAAFFTLGYFSPTPDEEADTTSAPTDEFGR